MDKVVVGACIYTFISSIIIVNNLERKDIKWLELYLPINFVVFTFYMICLSII
jgi:hypothetical protein